MPKASTVAFVLAGFLFLVFFLFLFFLLSFFAIQAKNIFNRLLCNQVVLHIFFDLTVFGIGLLFLC